ncbi:putative condensin subunit cnd1 [Erysiphe neolycopersici]|uniref:Putative condensin subunit cnd1 n=1 Tax=Erysiphe neolycopersici TaxID=212602 RepID=A0A420I081_9PEZI|nr:putative condensin subunit cnd1 [Erysiphe neolycopersici]
MLFFEVLEDRFLDVNPCFRCRTIQVYFKLVEKFPKRRQRAAEFAARSLEDKSSNVRRKILQVCARGPIFIVERLI